MIFVVAALLFLLSSCTEQQAGNTTETTNVVQAEIVTKDGFPVQGAHLRMTLLSTEKDTAIFKTFDSEKVEAQLIEGTYSFEVFSEDSSYGVFFTEKIFEKETNLGTITLSPTFSMNGVLDFTDANFSKVKLVGTGHDHPLSTQGNVSFSTIAPGRYEVVVYGAEQKLSDTLDLRNPPNKVFLNWQTNGNPVLTNVSNDYQVLNLWNFDIIDSVFIQDSGPRAMNGYISGLLDYVEGHTNTGVLLKSKSHIHFSDLPEDFAIQPNEDFSFSLWFNSPKAVLDTLTLLSTLPIPDYGFEIKLTPEKTAFLEITNYSGSNFVLPVDFETVPNTWNHLFFYRAGNHYGIEINQEFSAVKHSSISHEFAGGILNLGVNARYNQYFEGMLDEVYFFKGVPPDSILKNL